MYLTNCLGSEICHDNNTSIEYANDIIIIMKVITEKPDYSKYHQKPTKMID